MKIDQTEELYKVPFKTPSEYFKVVLQSDYSKIKDYPKFRELMKNYSDWDNSSDLDLHVYPYTKATTGILSVGCNWTCYFCPTAQLHKGKIVFGDYEELIPMYENQVVHFMDENFFMNDMEKILPLMKKYNVTWLAMSTYPETKRIIETFGEDYLFDCGLRVIEIGLENVALMRKVKAPIKLNKIEIFYLNLTFLPNETKETIKANGDFMKENGLKNPIKFDNATWFGHGQFYFPYEPERAIREKQGIMIPNKFSRLVPTFVPTSLLDQDINIINVEMINYYCQLIHGWKLFPEKTQYNIREFIDMKTNNAIWLAIGLRIGAII